MSLQRRNFICPDCDCQLDGVWSRYKEYPNCPNCQAEMECGVWACATFEWSTPRYIASLDKTFGSRSELEQYKKDNNLRTSPKADKHHGARNEEYLSLGKLHSDPKAKSKKSYDSNYGDRRA